MSRAPDLPQTVGEAVACGWRWLTVECRGCRHRSDLTLAGLTQAFRLAAIDRRLACQNCGKRGVRVWLGACLGEEGGQRLTTSKRIAFDGEQVVRPIRD